MDRRCADPNQQLVLGGHRPRHLTEPEVVDPAIPVLDDRSHARTVLRAAGDMSTIPRFHRIAVDQQRNGRGLTGRAEPSSGRQVRMCEAAA